MDPNGAKPTLVPVESAADKKAFIQLPKRLYRDDPNWIAPLDLEQKQRLFGNNPFFEHADCQAWLAIRGGDVVGRICAQVDHLHETQHGEKVGYFGMLEAANDTDIVRTLVTGAENWLRQRGMVEIRGPFNLSINEETGLLVAGFDKPPFIMMGHAHPYMAALLENSGYRKARDLFTYLIDAGFETPPVMAKLVASLGDRVAVRPLNRKRAVEEFDIIRDIFNDAWSGNWGFVPFTRREFSELARMLSYLVDDDYVQIAEVDGQAAAFMVALPNINEAIRDLNGRLLPFGWAKLLWRLKVTGLRTARIPLMGVRQQFQNSRLGPALAFLVIDATRQPGRRNGVREVEMGWILEDNAAMRNIIETLGGTLYKTYRVYRKAL